MPLSNVMQTRSSSDDHLRRTACRDFSYGQCYHPDCRFSHSILDCSRLACLNQDVAIGDDPSKARLTLEYNASAPSSALHGASGVWTVSLQGDQCSRTVKSKNAVEAFKSVETQLNRPAWTAEMDACQTICKRHLSSRCTKGSACSNRHDLFDTSRIEVISKKLQSVGRATEDANVSISYTYSSPPDSCKWHVAFTILQNNDFRTENIFADSDLGVAVAIAERRLSSIPAPGVGSMTAQRGVNAGSENSTLPGSERTKDSPPSYEAATSTVLPHYDPVLESPYSSRLMPPNIPHNIASSTSAGYSNRSTDRAIASAISPKFAISSCMRNRGHTTRVRDISPSERRPLLQQDCAITITYDSINHPHRDSRRSTSEWGRRPQDEGTPLVLKFLALVMFSAIAWVIIVAITLPCTEAACSR